MQRWWRIEEGGGGRNIRCKGMWRMVRRVRLRWQRVTEGLVVVAEK